jgi:hypothetical protein
MKNMLHRKMILGVLKEQNKNWAGLVAQVVNSLPSKYEALSSNPRHARTHTRNRNCIWRLIYPGSEGKPGKEIKLLRKFQGKGQTRWMKERKARNLCSCL